MSLESESVTDTVSLASLPVGAHARILEVRGGRQMTRRLLSLGLRVGSEVDVLQHRGRGVVVANGGVRVALGGGVAEKLLMSAPDSGTT
ncbi:MAG: ferrous iron transport protein A [gamma proteobacterium endosymbiont of Lamellibrachia anaximandri]|nr:ferrous iron transport protein A [gamma proteobacterium endosymbiont of Lamellibrachia anaximandri]MBL3534413.1 ferrous iron transport protein A [gamma proteobacterium endosymbiont of Lamellibrachia anaximandri]